MFNERIKELRQSLGITQVQFARKLFISKQCVCNWENGNIMPSIDMLIKVCKTFSVSADYLLGINNDMSLDVSGLNSEQILHIQSIVNDIRELNYNTNHF